MPAVLAMRAYGQGEVAAVDGARCRSARRARHRMHACRGSADYFYRVSMLQAASCKLLAAPPIIGVCVDGVAQSLD